MITKQCKWYDVDNDIWLGGIFLTDERGHDWIICGCCGGVQDVDELDRNKIEFFKSWLDISEEIIGE